MMMHETRLLWSGLFASFPCRASAFAADILRPVDIDDMRGFINETGTVVIPPQFEDVGHFHEGLARVARRD